MNLEIVKPGKFISLTYTIFDMDGNLLEQNDIPVSYIYGGEKALIGRMDDAVQGKTIGDEVQVLVPPEEGFGEHDPDLTFTDDIENVPPQFRHVGAEVQMQNESGDLKTFFVTHIDGDQLTVDGNHPMAGKTLKVNVKILEVREPTQADLNPEAGSNAIN